MKEAVKNKRRLALVYIITVVFIAAMYYLFTAAIPGRLTATHNQTPVPPNTTLYSYSNEISHASAFGIGIGASQFSCSSSLQCAKLLLSRCDNNLPSQFICINGKYYGQYLNLTKGENKTGYLCPMFLVMGNIGCSCISSYCTETYSK
ncbi:MAG: hypothetical protein M1448_02540 [Candidatus Marsarchaeota archaeon]|jgi:hypothetical protein|nr:hypothetical protein [Candidatus Marsarchaeota archaeon]